MGLISSLILTCVTDFSLQSWTQHGGLFLLTHLVLTLLGNILIKYHQYLGV